MTPGTLIALAALGLAAAYALGKDPFGIFNALGQALSPLEATLQAAADRVLGNVQQFTATEQERSGAAGYAGAITATGSAAGIAATAGAAALTVALVAGIVGGAAILVWGIVKRGWFRGGEEALYVSPARDELIDVTATIPFADKDVAGLQAWPTPKTMNIDGRTVADMGSIGPRSEWSRIRYESMIKAFVTARVDASTTESVIGQLYAADSMAEFEPAAYRYVETLQAGARAQGVAV